MTPPKYVAYYRVSTERQGRSGLGLEAQREAVRQFLSAGGWPPIAEFTEIETGKGSNALAKRPQLQAAINACKREKATLIIARLDRLARNVAFVSALMETKIDFVAVDNPTANRLTVHILAAVAEDEARRISERTRAALQAAKARGKRLGVNGTVLALRHRQEALERVQGLAPVVRELRAQGLGVRALAAELNRRAVLTPAGGVWHPTSAARLIKRLAVV